MSHAWTLTQTDGIATLCLNLPNEKVNKLTTPVMHELSQVLDELQHTKPSALLITSSKDNMFIAGADIAEIQHIATAKEGIEKARMGQAIFSKLANLPFPTIAVIDGPCLGGGMELALACHFRIATDNPKTSLGLPEVQLGILPGFGGTQRLPRIVGLKNSLELILSGTPIPPQKALKIQLIDALFPKEFIAERTREFLSEITITSPPAEGWRKATGWVKHWLATNRLTNLIILTLAKRNLMKKTHGNYPAPLAALDVIEKTYGGDLDVGLEEEARQFSQLIGTDTCKNLINLFFLNEQIKKFAGTDSDRPIAPIQHAGILGAGLMGSGIAYLLTSQKIGVRLKDIHFKSIAKGFAAVAGLYKKQVERKKVAPNEAMLQMHQLSGTLDWTGFNQTDIVIEAIVEDMEIKKATFKELEANVKPTTILATNTSSLDVTEMSAELTHPERFIGLHFFSPVHRMPLVEIIPSSHTSEATIAATIAFAKQIKKTPIVVKNRPGFLVNRILLPYVNEAIYLLEEGHTVTGIDALMVQWGMPLGPLALADEVGLDVGMKVSKILEDAYGDRMAVSKLFEVIHTHPNWLGKKSSQGFYRHTLKDTKRHIGIESLVRSHRRPGKPCPNEDAIRRMILIMVNEASRCLEEGIIDRADFLDMAMLTGTGFPPFRGGLLRYADSLGLDAVCTHLTRFTKAYGSRFSPSELIQKMVRDKQRFYSN